MTMSKAVSVQFLVFQAKASIRVQNDVVVRAVFGSG